MSFLGFAGGLFLFLLFLVGPIVGLVKVPLVQELVEALLKFVQLLILPFDRVFAQLSLKELRSFGKA